MSPPARLSALDAAFLGLESKSVPFVIGSILRFDRPIELARLRAWVDGALDGLPRYRQKIARIPVLGHPIWVDDDTFAVERHVLAAAGETGRDAEEVATEVLAHGLPPDRPPWQLWLVDGADGKSSIVTAVHHSLVDGVSGVQLLERLLSGVPREGEPPGAHRPPPERPPPRYQLLAREIRQRARALAEVGAGLGRPSHVARAAVALVWRSLHPAVDIGLNPWHVGSTRSLAAATVDLDSLRRIRRAHGVTLNDVVLAAVTGALRQLLVQRGIDPDLARDVRAMVPVSTLRAGEQAVSGNRVALLLTPLPVDEPDPLRRLRRVAIATRELKQQSGQREAGELMVQLSDATTPGLLTATFRAALAMRAFNLVVTNIPGPPFPLYLMDARLDSITPFVNLWPHGALGIAVLSYQGRLSIGLQADRAIVADLRPFARELVRAFTALEERTFPVGPAPEPTSSPDSRPA
jgi:diacylglycerol O-acyltransferase / wax synthase